MKSYGLLILVILFQLNVSSQIYTSSIGDFPIGYSVTDFPIEVNGLTPEFVDNSFGLEKVCIDVSYFYVPYLTVLIVAPDGIATKLSDRVPQGGSNFSGTCFTMEAENYLTLATAPFIGDLKPHQSFGQLNNGQNGNGIWYLRIINLENQGGSLNSCSITFGNNPAKNPIENLSSTLPLVLISTTDRIVDEPKVGASITIIENENGQGNKLSDTATFTSTIGIELRGASSQAQPKLAYGFETWDSIGAEIDTSFLSFPSESDWALIASYPDRTFMRNYLTYEMHRRMGNYSPRMRLCELFIDGVYQGIYSIGESIRRDKNRVDIAKLNPEDISGDELTGGYIFKRDGPTSGECEGWYSSVLGSAANPFFGGMYWLYQYPQCGSIIDVQKDYLANYIDGFETVLMSENWTDLNSGYLPFINLRSFIDYEILAEFAKSIDGYRKSVYFYKDKDSRDKRIVSGPLWDYDLAWGLDFDICGITNTTGWSYEDQSSFSCYPQEMPYWYLRLMQDTTHYVDSLNCRWTNLREGILSNNSLYNFIDSTIALIDSAQIRNFQTWPILFFEDFDEEIIRLKNWIITRGDWIDDNLTGTCEVSTSTKDQNLTKNKFILYPNPTKNYLNFECNDQSKLEEFTIKVYTLLGELILEKSANSNQPLKIDWPNGTYFYSIKNFDLNINETGKITVIN